MLPIKRNYQLELYMKNELPSGTVLVPMRAEYKTLAEVMKKIRQAEASPTKSYAKAVVFAQDIYKGGMRVQNGAPMVHIIDAEFLKYYQGE